MGNDADIEALEREIQALRSEVQFYRDREKHYARLLQVTDGGQYRADWDSAIDRLIRERDETLTAAQRVAAEQDRIAAGFQEERDKAQTQVNDLLRFIVGIQWVRQREKTTAFCPACTAPFGSHADSCFLRKLLWEHGLLKERDDARTP